MGKKNRTLKASSRHTCDRRPQKASAAADEHEEAQRTPQPVDAHHLSQHGDVDGHRGAVCQAVGHAEDGQLGEGGGQRAEEHHSGQDED